MLNFNDIKYERLDLDETSILVNKLLDELNNCLDFKRYVELVESIISIQNNIEEMYDYADIRNMRNQEDVFYKNEIEYWNLYKAKYDSLFIPFYEELKNSRFKDKLKEVLPSNFLRIVNYQTKIISSDIDDLIALEKDLMYQYRNLNKTKIMYDGKERTIGIISSLFSNKDRSIRKKAHDTINDYYLSKQKEYDSILFKLVNVRNKIAKQLGFDNYVKYSLYKLKRFDYDYNDIRMFRDNIIKYIIPIIKILNDYQKEELKLDELKYYDTVFFTSMPKLKYTDSDLLNRLRDSFEKCDLDLSNLFSIMLDNNYIDLQQRDNKVNFSITNYLTKTCMPVITGNYKNSYLDVQTTTHEMGHSYQKYLSSKEDKKHIVSSILKYPTMEIAEMFSYSMELIMMKYVDNIFDEDDYKKYCFMKIYNLISNLPYICLVDEFQEIIYSKEDLKQNDIRKIWLLLADKYNLKKSNSGHINLDSGGYFYRQSHIYLDPFYYIDYALSYFGAFSIRDRCNKNLDLFKEIGKVASYYSFKELIDKYNMPNPFDEMTVKKIADKLKLELESNMVYK